MSFNSSNQSYRNGHNYRGGGNWGYGSRGGRGRGGYSRRNRSPGGYSQDSWSSRDNRNPNSSLHYEERPRSDSYREHNYRRNEERDDYHRNPNRQSSNQHHEERPRFDSHREHNYRRNEERDDYQRADSRQERNWNEEENNYHRNSRSSHYPPNDRFHEYRNRSPSYRSPSPRPKSPIGGTPQYFQRNIPGSNLNPEQILFLGEIIRHMKFDPDRPVSPIEIGDDVREAIRNDAIERNRRLEGGIQEGRINEGRNGGTEMTVVRGRGRNARVIARLRLEQRIPQRTLVERLQLPNNRNWMAGIDLNSSHNDPPQFQDDFVTKREPFSRRICKKEYVGTRLWNPCLFCDGPHKADECCNIVHVRDRKEFINRASRCLRCFQRHHIDNCPHLERDCCKYCHDTSGDLHHPALCDKPKTIFL